MLAYVEPLPQFMDVGLCHRFYYVMDTHTINLRLQYKVSIWKLKHPIVLDAFPMFEEKYVS